MNKLSHSLVLITLLQGIFAFAQNTTSYPFDDDFKKQNLTGKPKDLLLRQISFATSRPVFQLKKGGIEIYNDVNYMEPADHVSLGFANVQLPLGTHKRGALERYKKSAEGFKLLSVQTEIPKDFIRRPYHIKQPKFLVFIHGYNNNFEDSILQTAQLAEDLPWGNTDDEYRIYAYSWLSRGFLPAYVLDRTFLDREGQRFQEFLELLIAAHPDSEVHLIAHSMGNEIALRALENMSLKNQKSGVPKAKKPFNNIILAAPDVSIEDFEARVPHALRLSYKVTHYFSTKDIAIGLSPFGNWGKERAGGQPIFVEGLDSIDTDSINSVEIGLGHSYFGATEAILDDINVLTRSPLAFLLSPSIRQHLKWENIQTSNGTYWKIRN